MPMVYCADLTASVCEPDAPRYMQSMVRTSSAAERERRRARLHSPYVDSDPLREGAAMLFPPPFHDQPNA